MYSSTVKSKICVYLDLSQEEQELLEDIRKRKEQLLREIEVCSYFVMGHSVKYLLFA